MLTKRFCCDILILAGAKRHCYGGIAQLARAIGSYPIGRGFKSNFRYHRPVGQAVKTPPFHGGNGGSIPPRVTKKKSQPFGWDFFLLEVHGIEPLKSVGFERTAHYRRSERQTEVTCAVWVQIPPRKTFWLGFFLARSPQNRAPQIRTL